MMARAATSLLLLGSLLGAARPAAAQAEGAVPGVDELIERGLSLREEGRDTEALAVFREAHALGPSGQTLGQIALAEQAVGHFVAAERDLQAALELGGGWVDRNRAPLEDALESIRAQLGQLVLAGGVEGAEVRINDRRVGTLPLEPQSVQAGVAVVEITAPGYVPYRRQIEITGGERARREVVLVERPEGSEELGTERGGEPAPAGPDDGLIAATVVSLSLGGAGLALFGVAGAAALAEHGSVNARCGAAMACSESDVSTLRALSLTADVGLGVGAAALAAGVVLLVVTLSSEAGSSSALLELSPDRVTLRGSF